MNDKKKRIAAAAVYAVICVGIALLFLPLLKNLQTPQGRADIAALTKSAGVWGALAFVAIQAIQIIVAIIPGEPFELLGGILYGAWGGLFLCLAGIFIGTLSVFFISKKYGKPFIALFFDEKKLEKFSFLQNEEKLELMVFILFLVPGTPKDLLTYIVPLTKISPRRYFIISVAARIPSVITSTMAGDGLSDGKLVKTLIIFGITAVLGIIGILLRNRITKKRFPQ